MKNRILKLAKEPSSYAGLAGLVGGMSLLGLGVEGWEVIFGAVAAVAGAVAMFLLDPADKEDEK